MFIFDKFKEKFKNLRHKEVVFFVIIIVLILLVWFFMKNQTKTTSTNVSFSNMSAKDELTYRITDAINAISGDNNSKVIIYWDRNENSTEPSFSSLFEGSSSTADNNTKISGIAVVCKNGNNAETKVRITFMLSNVFGIGTNRISVYGKK